MNKIDKQEAHQAPPPAFLRSVIEQSKKEPQIDPGRDRDRVMADFADSDAWKVLKKFIEAKQMTLASDLRKTAGEVSIEETGFRFLILDQVNTFATQITNFVEAPKEIARIQNERILRDNSSGKGKAKKKP